MMEYRHSKQGYRTFFGAMLNDLNVAIDKLSRQRKNKKKVERSLLLDMEARTKNIREKFKNVSTGRMFFHRLNFAKEQFKIQ